MEVEDVSYEVEVTPQHKHFLVVPEPSSLSAFVSSPLLPLLPHSASRRTSKASPWGRTPPWRPRSAPGCTARTRGARRNAACREWSGTCARTLCFWRSAPPPPSESGRSPSLARRRTPPPTPRTGCRRDPRPGTAGRGRAAAPSPRGRAGAPGRRGSPDRTSGGSGPGRPGCAATRSSPGRRREPAGRDAGVSEPHGSPSLVRSQWEASVGLPHPTSGCHGLSRRVARDVLLRGAGRSPARHQPPDGKSLRLMTCGDQGAKVSLHLTPTNIHNICFGYVVLQGRGQTDPGRIKHGL